MKKLLPFICATLLFASCTQDEAGEVLKAGEPVEINLSLGLANVDGPDVTLSTSNSSVAKAYNSNNASTQCSDASDAALKVTYSGPKKTSLRATTTLNNVWILQFDSTGVIGTAGNCVAAKYLGTVRVGEYLNPTLITGTNQVVYVLANGPASGNITTSTYTLATFKESAAFTGTITDDSAIPYLGRIAGGITLTERGTIKDFATVTLQRIVAKVSLTLNFNVAGYTLTSVQLFNAPTYMYYESGAGLTAFPETPSSSNITTTGKAANIIPSTAASGTYTWYTGENKRGTSSTATTAYLKDFLHTPTDNSSYYYCTYIHIKTTKNDSTDVINYYLYVGANGTTDFNVKRNWDYAINATIGGNQATQEAFMGIDGRIRKATSNCYMVAPSSTIKFPVNVKGNSNGPLPPDASSTVLAGTGLSTTNTAAAVSVLWQTAPGLIPTATLNTTTQMVNLTTSASTGNAVIAAYASDGTTILWSWHIWVTDYNPKSNTTGDAYTFDSRISMNRNLGAISTTAGTLGTMGLMYQWGRKDPFPGASTVYYATNGEYNSLPIYSVSGTLLTEEVGISGTGIKHELVTVSNNLSNSIQKPMTFYLGSLQTNVLYDWYTITDVRASQNDSLWGGASDLTPTSKTIFDPCPVGWRVPPRKGGSTYLYSPWGSLGPNGTNIEKIWANYGLTFTSAGYYPGTGYRRGLNGSFHRVGSFGGCWMASMYNTTGSIAAVMNFSDTYLYTLGGDYRGFGYPVRCFQEF
jgi:hypothetical protein